MQVRSWQRLRVITASRSASNRPWRLSGDPSSCLSSSVELSSTAQVSFAVVLLSPSRPVPPRRRPLGGLGSVKSLRLGLHYPQFFSSSTTSPCFSLSPFSVLLRPPASSCVLLSRPPCRPCNRCRRVLGGMLRPPIHQATSILFLLLFLFLLLRPPLVLLRRQRPPGAPSALSSASSSDSWQLGSGGIVAPTRTPRAFIHSLRGVALLLLSCSSSSSSSVLLQRPSPAPSKASSSSRLLPCPLQCLFVVRQVRLGFKL